MHTRPAAERPHSRGSTRCESWPTTCGRIACGCWWCSDANPVYSAPVDFKFTEALEHVSLRVHFGLYQDETARRCHWHLNQAHFLETWGDAWAADGTASIMQPLIEPLYRGRSAVELVAFLATLHETPGEELVRSRWRDYWNAQTRGPKSEEAFDQFCTAPAA